MDLMLSLAVLSSVKWTVNSHFSTWLSTNSLWTETQMWKWSTTTRRSQPYVMSSLHSLFESGIRWYPRVFYQWPQTTLHTEPCRSESFGNVPWLVLRPQTQDSDDSVCLFQLHQLVSKSSLAIPVRGWQTALGNHLQTNQGSFHRCGEWPWERLLSVKSYEGRSRSRRLQHTKSSRSRHSQWVQLRYSITRPADSSSAVEPWITGYTTLRKTCDLSVPTSFAQLDMPETMKAALQDVYEWVRLQTCLLVESRFIN